MYIHRTIENKILHMKDMFSIILLTGSRQVGKTTLLKYLFKDLPYYTFDDPILLQSAKEEAGIFIKNLLPPVIIDEIQYVPTIFPYLKMSVDEKKEKGMFLLTGSQQFHLMKSVSESLVGRLGVINLQGLSLREKLDDSFEDFFIPTTTYFRNRKKTAKKLSYQDVWQIIHRGSMPVLHAEPIDWQLFYSSYIKTYIERDVRQLTQVGDEMKFLTFMTVIAGRTAQMLNITSVARDVGISVSTADRWLSILLASQIIYLLYPYHTNITKRAIKAPKLYFLDTGLAAYLTRWSNPDVLEAGAMNGAFFETFVIGEVLKSFNNAGFLMPPLYYYRDKDGVEVDLLIELNGVLHPLEIKKTSNPDQDHIKAFFTLQKKEISLGNGGIICLYDECIPLNKNNTIIPITWL